MFAGQVSVSVGAVTVTEKVQFAFSPLLVDVAVTDTLVVPIGKLLPDAGEPVTVMGGTPPDGVAV